MQAFGVRIRLAARYHSSLALKERIQVSDDSRWRPASDIELSTLCAEPGEPTAREVFVIGLPRHLVKRWWDLAESAVEPASRSIPGFEGYAREIAEYFSYKRWPLPDKFIVEALVARGDNEAGEMQASRATRFDAGIGAMRACINLGYENLPIVLAAESVDTSQESSTVRVILESGEGLMLPAGIIWKQSATADSDLNVMLLLGVLGLK